MNVREAFLAQGEACAALGSPFMGRLMPLIGARLSHGAVAERILSWPGDPSAAADSVPLRLAGALHALRIEKLALEDVYPPAKVGDENLWSAVSDTLIAHEDRILAWLENPPQTNEVRRAAPLMAALSVVAERYPGPVELIELGCSAGLNLRADHFAVIADGALIGSEVSRVRLAPVWESGKPTGNVPPIVARRGVDLSPIDPGTTRGRLKLLAYLWPDQPGRIAITEAAIAIAREVPAEISSGDAGTWLERVLTNTTPERTRVVFHTVAWQYFPASTKARATAAMERVTTPLVRFGLEAAGGRGARMTLTHYPSGEVQDLGRADFHGRWVEFNG